MTRLYAIDASAIHHWLWHSAHRDANGNDVTLRTKVAEWYGTLCARLDPTHIVACLDGRNNWRAKEWVEYKSSRAAKPPDEAKLAALNEMPGAWAAWGVPTLRFDTFEADDTIAALCNVHASPECEVVIVASDKDLMQLVGPHVKQYDPRPNKDGECKFYDEAAVEEKFGVLPHRMRELLAIWGDSSDDVPGVEGWGKTRAVNAIRQTKSSAELWRKAASNELKLIDAKYQQSLIAQRAAYELSYKLVGLRFDVPVPADLSAFARNASEQFRSGRAAGDDALCSPAASEAPQ